MEEAMGIDLIFACDVSDEDLGVHLIGQVAEEINFVKVGLEAMTAENNAGETLARRFRLEAQANELGVMWDMKLHDIGNTVAKAVKNIAAQGSRMFTLHATASDAALAAAVEAASDKTLVLAVTVLTDLDEIQCQSRFATSAKSAVRSFAKNAHHLGVEGFVCSGEEAPIIREAIPSAHIVTPAIRPLWAVTPDEQKRVTTPTQAKRAGANAIVVGRPISNPPPSRNHWQAAREIREELDAA